MAKSHVREQVQSKIEELRKELLGDVSLEDIQQMQNKIDLLEQAISDAYDFHHHDTEWHHDHVGKPEFMDITEKRE